MAPEGVDPSLYPYDTFKAANLTFTPSEVQTLLNQPTGNFKQFQYYMEQVSLHASFISAYTDLWMHRPNQCIHRFTWSWEGKSLHAFRAQRNADLRAISDLGGLCPAGSTATSCPFSGAPTISPNEVSFYAISRLLSIDNISSQCSSFITEYDEFCQLFLFFGTC